MDPEYLAKLEAVAEEYENDGEQTYLVIAVMEIDATSPREAARIAQREVDLGEFSIFEVSDNFEQETDGLLVGGVNIDLSEDEDA